MCIYVYIHTHIVTLSLSLSLYLPLSLYIYITLSLSLSLSHSVYIYIDICCWQYDIAMPSQQPLRSQVSGVSHHVGALEVGSVAPTSVSICVINDRLGMLRDSFCLRSE